MSNYGGLITEQEKDYIKSHISYDSDSGRITRDDRKGGLGSKDKDGYLILKIKGKQYKAHRIAWFLFYGEFPNGEIDHINRNKQDNRISNLRIVSRIDNIKNRLVKPNSDTGVIGVYLDKATKGLKKKYVTRIQDRTHRFYTLEDAINFRIQQGYAI